MTPAGYRGGVKRVAVAGGIGAGKTAACERLSALGFAVVDADVIARAVVRPGEPAWVALRDAFGTAVLDERGDVDRAFLADVVFHDGTALRRLNAVTHPAIGREIARQLDAAHGDAVFLALPLFRPEHRAAFRLDEVWAIQVDPSTACERLREGRGYSDDEARARLAAQMSNEERASVVDRVIWNEGSLEDLYARLDEALDALGVSRA